MKILFNPQVRDYDEMVYTFSEDFVKVTQIIGGETTTDTFDFRPFPNGKLKLFDEDTGESLIETSLKENPLRRAERKNGTLYLELINFIALDASHEECFPDWIDHEEYKTIKVGSEKDSDELKDWDDF